MTEPDSGQEIAKLDQVQLDAQVDLLAKYNECNRAIKYWKTELERTKEQLIKMMGDAVEGTVDGRVVFTYKPIERFNVTEFKREYPDLHRLFTREMSKVEFDEAWFRNSRPELWQQFQVRTVKNDFGG